MRYPHRLRLIAVLAVTAVAAAAFAAAAGAGKATHEAWHNEGTFVVGDFCGVSGLDVRVDFAVDIRLHIVPRGREQLAYFLHHIERTETLTNLADGTSIRYVVNATDKDMRVTDNGDGTLTVLVLATGNATMYGSGGKAIGRDPGQVRYELLLDHGGTPGDPSDDELLEFLGYVKGSTGRSDGFCDTAVPALS